MAQFILALLLSLAPALAAERVIVHRAQLSGPLGSDTGKVIIVNDRMIFVDDVNPANSFEIPRSEITALNYRDGIMSMTLNPPFAGSPFGTVSDLTVRMIDPAAPGAFSSWLGMPLAGYGEANRVVVTPSTSVYEFSVKKGGDHGRLVIGPTQVRFEDLDNRDHSRVWSYSEIKEFKEDRGDHEVKIVPYHGDDYKFKVEGDRYITSEVYNLVADRIAAARP